MNLYEFCGVTPDNVRDLFFIDDETGKVYWKERTKEMQPHNRSRNVFNAKFAGKEAGFFQPNHHHGCMKVHVYGKAHMIHRIVWLYYHGEWPSDQIDHINGITTDNRISNLRVVNHTLNQRNRCLTKINKSGYPGINWHKQRNKWQARIVNNDGKRISLGCFSCLKKAVQARKKMEKECGYHENHGRNPITV